MLICLVTLLQTQKAHEELSENHCAVFFSGVFCWFQKPECCREETLVLGSEVLYILGNRGTWEWILQSNMIMGHIFFLNVK